MPNDGLSSAPPLPASVLEQAADWLLRLHDSDNPATRAACEHWCAQHPDHALAWQRAQRLQGLLAQVPGTWAMPVLGRAQDPQRRTTIKRIGLWLALAPAGWAAWQGIGPRPDGPPVRTAVGERRRLTLPDGSALQLDTDSRVHVRFDAHHRRVQLERGQIHVDTAIDPVVPARPLEVLTAHGRVRALGTRFNVRVEGDRTRLALMQGELEIHAGSVPPWRLQAGQQAWFDEAGQYARDALDDSAWSWTGGMLLADARPLADLLAELARYRRGIVRCDPQIARLPVSGAYPVDDTERSLALLEATYPIRVVRSLGGRWLVVAPR